MELSKSKLSQFLRTRCDRSLYLSLHSEAELEGSSLPPPLTARPGVQYLREAGFELERACFRRLENAFGNKCVGKKGQPKGHWGNAELPKGLSALPDGPGFLIHPKYELESYRATILTNLGVSEEHAAVIPRLAAHVPDIVAVDIGSVGGPRNPEYWVAPNGDRVAIEDGEARRRLTVIDIKHAQEANTSYESEVALYAVALANWLAVHGLETHYYVSADMCLWTNGGVADGRFAELAEDTATNQAERLEALRAELSCINAPIYLQAIRRFMSEQLPSVIAAGNADFESLDWHVCSRCGSCDWLGHRAWLGHKDRARVDANPNDYCFPKAEADNHLSRVPLITRGARRVLERDDISTVGALERATGNEDVFREHTGLKSNRRSLPALAHAITTGESGIDEERADGGLARYADLDVFISVNFDVGAGQLTGLGLEGRFRQHTLPGESSDVQRTWREQWIVSGKSAKSEGASVRSFLNYLGGVFDWIRDEDPNRGGEHAKRTTAQLLFWDQRQYEQLCLAVGRHLPAILYGDEDRTVKALVWLFPPEEIQERDTIDASRPGVAFVSDLVRRLVHPPALHELTLFNVVEHYHWGDEFRVPDSFYREPLSDSIPRERIYEIWSASATGDGYLMQWGEVYRDVSQLLDGFRRTVRTQTDALRMVVWKLRGDFGDRLKAVAPRLDLKVPRWGVRVAFEAKLWIAWASFSKAFDDVMAHRFFLLDPEEIEARYEGIRLERLIAQNDDGSLTYRVSPDSRDAKARAPQSFLCLSVDAIPGFLRHRVREVMGHQALPDHLQEPKFMIRAMSKVFKIKLAEFDREALEARIEWDNFHSDERELREAVFDSLGELAQENVTIVNSAGIDIQVRRLTNTLKEVRNPAIAEPTAETLTALGMQGARIPPGSDPITPVATALWDAPNLYTEQVRHPEVAGAIAAAAVEASVPRLNDSQRDAIANAAARRLSIIWGPPGTGKTQTCAALVHQLANYEATGAQARAFNILLTGPNYKAVSELAERVMGSMACDAKAKANFCIILGEGRENEFTVPDESVPGFAIAMSRADCDEPVFEEMMRALNADDGVNIVATVAHQCPRISEQAAKLNGHEDVLLPIFDFVLFDESSQADMAISIPALGLLRNGFQLVLAGDLLQMPPIRRCDPPVGAEFLVGSIQNYFVTRFGIAQERLLTNYRSANEIVRYIKGLGYPKELEAKFPHARLCLRADPAHEADTCLSNNLCWSDAWPQVLASEKRIVAITYFDGVCGQANPFEADMVTSLVFLLKQTTSAKLVDHRDQGDDIPYDDETFWRVGVGVVTPHRAQRAMVVRKLRESFPNTDPELIENAVDTVERFQGSERHTIIISFGVGDPDVIAGEERFLMQLERTNVAISRAMAKCIVLLSEDVVAHIPADREAIETAHALKGIVDDWCKEKRDATVICKDGSERNISVRSRPASDEP